MRATRLALALALMLGIAASACPVDIEELHACDTSPSCSCANGELGTALCRADETFVRCLCRPAGDFDFDARADPDVVADPDVPDDAEDPLADADDVTTADGSDATADVAADSTPDVPVCDSVVSDPFDDGSLHRCWTSTEVGRGRTGFDEETTSLEITANGADIWNEEDQFRFVYQPLCGDVVVVLRVNYVPITHDWAKAGLMLRETLRGESTFAAMLVSREHGYAFQRRQLTRHVPVNDEGGTFTNDPVNPVPGYVRLARTGDVFSGAYSADAESWTALGNESTIPMDDCIHVGIAVTSHADGVLGEASFNDFVVVSGGAGQ